MPLFSSDLMLCLVYANQCKMIMNYFVGNNLFVLLSLEVSLKALIVFFYFFTKLRHQKWPYFETRD